MIPSIQIIGDEEIGIPILDSNEFCYLIWKEDEGLEAIERACHTSYVAPWCEFNVYSKYDDNSENGIFNIHVYDIFCSKTNTEYHLIVYGELDEFDDIKNSVCLPFNRLNLLKFFSEYLVPFSDKNILHG